MNIKYMNKKQIKRQLALHKLGIPIDKDIREYYKFFCELVGDRELITNKQLIGSLSMFTNNNDDILFQYYSDIKKVYINYDIIWKKFKDKFHLIWYNEICIYLSIFIEDFLSIEIKSVEGVSILSGRKHFYMTVNNTEYV